MQDMAALAPMTVRRGEGRTVALVGDVYTLVATGDQTGGAFALVEAVVPPGGGPPLHLHEREEECFYILEGTITFEVEGREIVAEPGTFVFSPRAVRHRFRNNGSTPARMLVQVTPAGFDRFLLEVGRPMPDSSATPPAPAEEDIQRLLETAPKYGIRIFAPA